MKRRNRKKLKKIQGTIMMMLMCIILLSASTYAWFTLSNTAKVSNLTMTVGEAKGLRVAVNPGNGKQPQEADWKGAISFEDKEVRGVLLPATYDKGTFYRPVYNDEGAVEKVVDDDKVMELTPANTNASKEGHYYTLTFYMESLGEAANIRLVKGENLTDDSRKGTYMVENKKGSKTEQNASAAIRIAITADGSNTSGIYEPNSDMTFTGTVTKAETISGYSRKNYSTIQQNADGTFKDGADHSETVFELEADTPTLITLHIWIEGDDEQCVNQIQMDNLIGQLQFEKDV